MSTLAGGAERLTAQRLTGEVAVETRWFPQTPLFPDQRTASLSPSVSFEPELAWDSPRGTLQVVVRPFARIDAHDDGRSHGDLREASLTWFGDTWVAMVGVGRVFWGVTEVHHLVDIVNQTDQVEDLDGEDKLGQPMVNLGLEGDWGALDLFWLPYFRERTFPDHRGRLRGPLPVVDGATYESQAERWHQDLAARWSRVVGAFDVGVSYFRGTSREPHLRPAGGVDATDAGVGGAREAFGLRPHYSLVDQAAVDLQWTGSAVLLKIEAMTRGGHGRRFGALTAGLEYTLYQVGSTSADLGLIAEVMIDGRSGEAPPTLFDRDVFGGLRWALNDANDTSVLGGVVVDYRTGESFAVFEAERRLSGDWTLELEARILRGTDPGSAFDPLRRDSFVTLRLGRFW